MRKAKVIYSTELIKLKLEKSKTAKFCGCEGCWNIGQWYSRSQSFHLTKGMCQMHYQKFKKYGDPLAGIFNDGRKCHPLHGTWYRLRDRITNKKCKSYPDYGGRGLKMEESWIPDITGFWQFLKDIAYLGERPKGFSLDREDNNLGYFVGNLKWSNRHQQNSNRRNNNNTVGVYWHKLAKKWNARLNVNKITVLSVFFDTYEEAVQARKDAEIKYNIYEQLAA